MQELGAVGSGGAFTGFVPADFDAFQKKKWSSNAYTLERRRAKDKVLAVGRALQESLSEELGDLELGASDEAPSVANGRQVQFLSLFFTRSAVDRASLKPLLQRTDLQAGASLFDIAVQHQHACLQMRLTNEGLVFGIELATKAVVDRSNVAHKLKNEWAQKKLSEICQGFPGGTVVGIGEHIVDALALDGELIGSWAAPLEANEHPFVAQVFIGRDEEILSADALIGTLIEYASVFLSAFRFFAWSRDNDYSQVKGAIQKQEADRRSKAMAYEPGDRVTILSGLFSGRAGYLAEIDSKGKAKVMVGPVSVTVDAKDLKGS